MIPPLLFLLQFFLRQEPLHDLGVDDAVQMIQLMAEAPGDQFLALSLEPLTVPVLRANLGIVGALHQTVLARNAEAPLRAALLAAGLHQLRIHQLQNFLGAPAQQHPFAGQRNLSASPVEQPDPLSIRKVFEPIERRNVTPSEAEIRDALRRMGKTKPEDELNCGSCGYNTCREKAIAICHGKAEVSMCLPFLKEKAESFSDSIINNTPNAIIVMDEDLVVQQINRAAVRMFKLKDANDILHEHIVRILNPGDYQNIITSALHTTTRMHYLADYELYVDETILYDRQYHIVISLMRDVTEQETLRGQDAELRRQTVEITDKVIEKQMRVVQEIASLLGETTAETKIALTKLKDAMAHE